MIDCQQLSTSFMTEEYDQIPETKLDPLDLSCPRFLEDRKNEDPFPIEEEIALDHSAQREFGVVPSGAFGWESNFYSVNDNAFQEDNYFSRGEQFYLSDDYKRNDWILQKALLPRGERPELGSFDSVLKELIDGQSLSSAKLNLYLNWTIEIMKMVEEKIPCYKLETLTTAFDLYTYPSLVQEDVEVLVQIGSLKRHIAKMLMSVLATVPDKEFLNPFQEFLQHFPSKCKTQSFLYVCSRFDHYSTYTRIEYQLFSEKYYNGFGFELTAPLFPQKIFKLNTKNPNLEDIFSALKNSLSKKPTHEVEYIILSEGWDSTEGRYAVQSFRLFSQESWHNFFADLEIFFGMTGYRFPNLQQMQFILCKISEELNQMKSAVTISQSRKIQKPPKESLEKPSQLKKKNSNQKRSYKKRDLVYWNRIERDPDTKVLLDMCRIKEDTSRNQKL